MHEEAMQWLDEMAAVCTDKEYELIEYIKEMLWRYEDMSNS